MIRKKSQPVSDLNPEYERISIHRFGLWSRDMPTPVRSIEKEVWARRQARKDTVDGEAPVVSVPKRRMECIVRDNGQAHVAAEMASKRIGLDNTSNKRCFSRALRHDFRSRSKR